MNRKERTAIYDPLIKRYRATCSLCGYTVIRAKAEAAEHVLAQHLAAYHV